MGQRCGDEACEDKVKEVTDYVLSVDYSAYAREILYSNPKIGLNKDFVHIDVLPDFILLPNVGVRGAMWQEIEAKKRSTPCRMMLPIFLLGELKPAILRMTGEYRWEMCKRIQGVHYSDISEPSLTSEYCNYLQFYKKNSSLSADMKEKVKTALKRNSNSYSNVFASEYEMFLKAESEGLPRLNKVSREILFKYCTFSQAYRDKLLINPQYKPLIERWLVGRDDRARTLELFSRRILTQTKELPEEVQIEAEYLKL